ncbi:hypothetical protein [Acidianus brierleyi]|uniref:Uncharacterized protein n=1 Tax=Acidianus brierleyi TaxID=41673 RepID=A0A2U9IB73_9CREN|nr:hypothetical protein [Acidianus brierleyi]AWR93262.1 hypothetical protein DFR85_00180 [Acidianus brierleyi]
MSIHEFFNCNSVKCMKSGEFCVEVDNVKITFTLDFTLGPITEISLKSSNYKVNCKILFDSRKEKIISVDCYGFKADKICKSLKECFREKGLLYASL